MRPTLQFASAPLGMFWNSAVRPPGLPVVHDTWEPRPAQAPDETSNKLLGDRRFQQLLPFLRQTLAVVDIGSSTAKLVILGPTQFQVAKYPLTLGTSLGMTRDLKSGKGIITAKAYESFLSALLHIRAKLLEAGVPLQHVQAVATAGLRDAINGPALVEEAHSLGIPLQIINGTEEARHAYESVTRSIPLDPQQPALVIEIGGGSTELAFGRGQGDLEESLTATLEVGTDRIHLQDPFDWRQVELGKWKARFAFAKALSQKPESVLMALQQTSRQRRVFVEPTTIYQLLRSLHLSQTGIDLFETGLTRDVIQHYLTPPGLQEIKTTLERYKALPASVQKKDLRFCFEALPGELIILNEIFEELQLNKLEFGAEGGLKMGFLLEMAAAQKEASYRRGIDVRL